MSTVFFSFSAFCARFSSSFASVSRWLVGSSSRRKLVSLFISLQRRGILPPLEGRVVSGDYLFRGYFEQEMTGAKNNTCIEELWCDYPSWSQYEVRSALAKCGLTTKHIESQVRVLSGGESSSTR